MPWFIMTVLITDTLWPWSIRQMYAPIEDHCNLLINYCSGTHISDAIKPSLCYIPLTILCANTHGVSHDTPAIMISDTALYRARP